MPVDANISATRPLADARHFEDAAEQTLMAMLDETRRVLEGAASTQDARVLRALVHLRPDASGYRRLFMASVARHARGEQAPFLPSASTWRRLEQVRRALAIDVTLGQATDGESPQDGFDNEASRERLLARDATHVYAIPLLAPGGALHGLIAIEVECRRAIGQSLPWSDCAPRLQLLADAAAPHLAALPPRPTDSPLTDPLLPVVGASMRALIEVLRVFARQEETILVSGPTGAGKSRLARWCHAHSTRAAGLFESLDLLSVPEELQMGELFGWRKGAFTGAVRDSEGCVGRAARGTLFIDEIDKLSLKAQAGFLRLLEERRYRALGEGGADRVADVRFIIGTNADLAEAVRKGRFREDLYYRINVLPARVPPLDERRDEIGAWAEYMARRRHQEAGPSGEVRLTDAARQSLVRRRWPGNLRQLDNIVRRAYTLALTEQKASGALEIDDAEIDRAFSYEAPGDGGRLPDALRAAASAFVQEARRCGALDLDLADALRGYVLLVATEQLGNVEAAFRLLGRDALVKSRNHHKAQRRELKKVEALFEALGVTPDPAVSAAMADD